MPLPLPAFLLVALCIFPVALADEYSHRYTDKEPIKLWVNTVGPYHNPQETYAYYSLPFCKTAPAAGAEEATEEEHKWGGLGEVLGGNDLVNSNLAIEFKEDIATTAGHICSLTLDEAAADTFKYAVENHYWYQFYIDDLPVWGMVGEVVLSDDGKTAQSTLLYTHRKLVISYNGNQIIQVNLTAESPQAIAAGSTYEMTYSVSWAATDAPYATRFERYLDYNFFEHQIHWFSIFNSFMMVIFLTGLVSLILMRTLRNDYAKYAKDSEADDLEIELDESGWKQVHGDVFRPPPNLLVFSALVGAGSQLACLTFALIMMAILGTLYNSRGALVTAFIVCYAMTSIVAGYTSGSLYSQAGGQSWIQAMVYTAALFPTCVFGAAFLLNFIAWSYHSLAAIPFPTMVIMLLIWAFIAFPLTLIGTIIGRNFAGKADHPCRVNSIPRCIPDRKWYLQSPFIVALGGVLPFGSIFIEMYFIFTSFWNYKFYYVYGFMLLVYVILIIVSVCVTIVATYFLLNNEDYRWQWTSFCSSASTAVYVYLYAVYYFFMKTKMQGLFQTCFYFGYMFMFCFGLAILCGTLGYWGTSVFVRRIYQNIKSD